MSQFRPVNFNQASVRANELVANTKLGIGTHSQTSELHIKATAPELQIEGASATMKVVASGSETTFRSDQDVKWTSADAGTVHMTLDGTSGNVQVGTANLFVDTTTGYVGVGTTEPAKELEVQGALRLSNATTGYSTDLAMSGTIGAWGVDTPYFYKIQPADVQQGDNFSFDVAISKDGNTAIASAHNEDTTASDAGQVYVFTRSGGISGSKWTIQQKFQGDDTQQLDNFGHAVGISGDGNTAIVGAPLENVSGTDQGAAYIFTRSNDTWTQQQKITASDKQDGDKFGEAVAISSDGSTVIVGARFEASNRGAVYVFTHSNGSWTEQQKIQSADTDANDYSATALAISGDGNRLVYSAHGYGASSTGAVLVYTRDNGSWSQEQLLLASDGQQYDRFGMGLAISDDGDTILVGAYFESPDSQVQAGSAYVFTMVDGSWTEQQKIYASPTEAGQLFGYDIALSSDGNTAVISAHATYYPGGSNAAGAVYIWTRSGSTWTQKLKIQSADIEDSDSFGYRVDMSSDGRTIIVSAYGEDTGGSAAGSAYIYELPMPSLTSSAPIEADGTLLSFTGQHICFPDGPMSQGLVVSANKNAYVSLNGPVSTGQRAIKSSESLPVVSLSNVASDRSAFGVVDRHEFATTTRTQTSGGMIIVRADKELGDNRVIVNSLGEGAMWVANTNGNLVSGDYITTSNVAGYGQKQDDDILHSYTVAKITMDCDFAPDDVPVQVIKKDAAGKNVLDTYGRIQWENTDRTEKAYRIRYLTTEGTLTDQANAVWTAAYVGCTYHCG